MMTAAAKKTVCLVVIDGWGISDETKGERAMLMHRNFEGSCHMFWGLEPPII